jgi:hypothetical protein
MKKRNSSPQRWARRGSAGVLIGRAGGEKISAVEGIKLSAAARRRADEFDRLGLSPEERRVAILRAYRKG